MMKAEHVVAFVAVVAFSLGVFVCAVWGITITETRVDCIPELVGRLHDTDDPNVKRTALYATCTTYDGTHQVVRPQREYDVTNRLTTQQKNQLTALLNALPTFVSTNEAIPTPVP